MLSGAFEIPNIISKNINKFNAFIALGCIIKGKTGSLFFYFTSCDKRALMNFQ